MKERQLTPMKAIRDKCRDCQADQLQEIRACSCINCSLWSFRLGTRPFSKKGLKNPLLDRKNFVETRSRTSSELLSDISRSTYQKIKGNTREGVQNESD